MSRQSGPPEGYIDVAERIAEFRGKYPDGSFQPANPDRPYAIEQIGDKTFVAVVAAAYRTPDDPRPGIGMAWEPLPGPTPFTKDSELQNAETSAWGRAIVAALAADTKRGVASANEVRNRQGQDRGAVRKRWADALSSLTDEQRKKVVDAYGEANGDLPITEIAPHLAEEWIDYAKGAA